MDKKKILIASLFAAIMILVPFTVVATDPTSSIRERAYDDDSKLEKVSEPDYNIPEYIDISKLDLTKDELAKLQKDTNDLNELITIVEANTGEELPVVDVPAILNGEEVMTMPIIDADEMSLIPMFLGGDDICSSLKASYLVFAALAAYYTALAIEARLRGDEWTEGFATAAAIVFGGIAADLLLLYNLLCKDESSDLNTQTVIDTIASGETVAISEILDVVQMIEGETCGCGV